MKIFDVIILGGGASGCMCASMLAGQKQQVLLIDKATVAGKKLMATGNGRCNLTNTNIRKKYVYNQDLGKYFSRFAEGATLAYFRSLGLETYADNEGRVYPFSNSAKSVIDVFANQFEKSENLTLQLETEFLSVEKQQNLFIVHTNKGDFSSKALVVALGGNCGKQIIETFNIPHKPFIPSLCALKTEKTKILENTKISNVKLTLTTKKGEKFTEFGEILFKDSGISGICIFNLSAMLAREGKFEGQLAIDLMPEVEIEFLKNLLKERKSLDVKVSKFFEGLFVNPLAYHILNQLKLDEEKSSLSLTGKEIDAMAKVIKNLTFNVKGNYENNQVFSGGVLLSSLDQDLQSTNTQNLYFTGEICDVDGVCGGYNLQWAWTSGKIVADAICNK